MKTTATALLLALLTSCSAIDKQLKDYDLTTADVIAAALATKADVAARQAANKARTGKSPITIQP